MANANKGSKGNKGSNRMRPLKGDAKGREEHNAQQRALVNVKTGKYALIRVQKKVYKELVKLKRAKKLKSLGAVVAALADVEL